MHAKFKDAKFYAKRDSYVIVLPILSVYFYQDIHRNIWQKFSRFKTYLFTGPIDFNWWFLASDGSVKLVRKIAAYQLKFHSKYMLPTFSYFNKCPVSVLYGLFIFNTQTPYFIRHHFNSTKDTNYLKMNNEEVY